MLQLGSALVGYRVDTTLGPIGTVRDLLFDDANWGVSWLRIERGGLFQGQDLVIPPSVIAHADHIQHSIMLTLTKAQFDGSPASQTHLPVSRQSEATLHDYDYWNSMWVAGGFGGGAMASPLSGPPIFGEAALDLDAEPAHGMVYADPHLRSLLAMIGYTIRASDTTQSRMKDLVINDAGWTVSCLIIDTHTETQNAQVLISPQMVGEIDFLHEQVDVRLTQHEIQENPLWEPTRTVDDHYDDQPICPFSRAQLLAVVECVNRGLVV